MTFSALSDSKKPWKKITPSSSLPREDDSTFNKLDFSSPTSTSSGSIFKKKKLLNTRKYDIENLMDEEEEEHEDDLDDVPRANMMNKRFDSEEKEAPKRY